MSGFVCKCYVVAILCSRRVLALYRTLLSECSYRARGCMLSILSISIATHLLLLLLVVGSLGAQPVQSGITHDPFRYFLLFFSFLSLVLIPTYHTNYVKASKNPNFPNIRTACLSVPWGEKMSTCTVVVVRTFADSNKNPTSNFMHECSVYIISYNIGERPPFNTYPG